MKCKDFIHKCKAECCSSFVPLPDELVEKFKKSIQRNFTHERPLFYITKSNKCIFLGKDHHCAIYNDRPEICKLFGTEQHILLKCILQKADGTKRSKKEQKMVKEEIDAHLLKRKGQRH